MTNPSASCCSTQK